ncbi:hypothetical protein ACJJJB_01505 [Microbulbifer sp. ANSA001]|uniref:hypothetical protein n=1 Tax=Microbulbifer sp. ANSA001 TaxID=3243358 RepID=UPI00404286FA
MNEAERVYWGLQQFVFAAKFAVCCQNEIIDSSVFQSKCTLNIDSDVTFDIPEWDAFNQSELVKSALNQMMISLGACSIAVDEALSIRNGNSSYKNWAATPSDLNSLREIMFLIRSAYAHKMPDVHWHISGARTTALYKVNTPDGLVEFDANGKHGTKLELSHFGGLKGYINLVNYASDLLK